jgi:hypothetical protein
MEVKKHIVFYVMAALSLVFPMSGYSQNYTEDMKKISEKYKKGDISYHVKYYFYPSDSLKKAVDSMNIYSCMSGQEYYCNVSQGKKSFEYFKNSKFYFVIDHSESVIAVKKSSDAQQQSWDIGKVDSLIHAQGVKITYKGLDNNEGEYSITLNGKTWDKLKIVFSKSDFTLEKIYMYSSSKGTMYKTELNKPVILMSFSGYSEKQLDKTIFSESKFFYETKDAIVLNESYKKYKLLDYIYKLSKRS